MSINSILNLSYDLIMQPETVVHCSTIEEAKELLTWADSKGLKWCDLVSYLDKDYYSDYRDQTCYNLKGGYIDCTGYFAHEGYTILEFKDLVSKGTYTERISIPPEPIVTQGYYKDLTLIDLKTRADQYQQFKKTGKLPDCELRTDIQRLQDSTPGSYFHISMLRTVLSLYETIAERFI
jgi:hypothetical protein